jgi:hypothetical protein
MPEVLEPGVLYVSEEFEVAGHLCACGCGNKVMTPLGPVDWSFEEVNGGPTLRPSIGSWQLPCRSHYWIVSGMVSWAGQWTPEQIERGRRGEEERLQAYFESRKVAMKPGRLATLCDWLKGLARRVFPWW